MTLRETLDLVPDFRSSQGRRHSLGAILALATCAMLCGARSLYAIAQWGRDQGGATAQLLGFSQEKTPCVATLHRVFKGLDVAAFEAEVGNWLANSGVEADDPPVPGRENLARGPRPRDTRGPSGVGLR